MARFLVTMLPANDLGLPTRMLPIARALRDRGHEVAVFNPAPAPSRLIAEAGLKVKRVLNEPSYRQSAKRVAESMGQLGGAVAAPEHIEESVLAQGTKRR
jgi:UDP:flavonoid glycosyltransferase YjiC (YdhE family)